MSFRVMVITPIWWLQFPNLFFFHVQFIEIIAPLPSILQRREEEAEDITIAPQQQTTA